MADFTRIPDPDSGLDDFEGQPIPCPGCGVPNDSHLAAQRSSPPPTDGDVGICAYCSTLAVYVTSQGRLTMRHPTDAEFKKLIADPDVVRVIAATRTAREMDARGE